VGPAAWSTVAPAGSLPFESPINITGAPIDLSQFLTIHYNAATPKAIINNGAQIQTQFNSSPSDSIVLDGQTYNLSQFHYHDTAENQVNGFTYPMEEHFVNVSASGAETVVAVFLQLGSHNAALQPVLDAASAHLTAPNSTTTINTPIDLAGLLPSSMEGWFYEGSLTTPPLSQTVNWLVLSTPITLDFKQLQQYEAVANGAGFLPNNRPLQPTDGRQVNQFNIDVNFQGQPIQGANFTFAPRSMANSTASTRTVNPDSEAATVAKGALAVQGDKAKNAITAQAASQNFQPVAGCNCPVCQMLRNATWHEVTPTSGPMNTGASTTVASIGSSTPAAKA
jgi:carbonic anhydrase